MQCPKYTEQITITAEEKHDYPPPDNLRDSRQITKAAISIWFGDRHTKCGNSHNSARLIETKEYGPVNDLPKALLCAALSALKTVYKVYKAANDPLIKPIVRRLFVRPINLKLSKLVAKSLQTLEQGNFQGHKSMRNIYHTLDKQISSLVEEIFLAYSNKHGLKQLQFNR
jgi:hypothetical protein